MAKDPSMPFYVNDWLSSTAVSSMTLAEQGAYVRLLCHCWASQDASLPDNDRSLSFLSGLGSDWEGHSSQIIRSQFTTHPTKIGWLSHWKIYELWNERVEWRAKSKEAGKRGAERRWGGNKQQVIAKPLPTLKENDSQTIANPMRESCPNTSPNDGSSSSSLNIYTHKNEKEIESIRSEIGDSLTFKATSDEFNALVLMFPKRMQSGHRKAFTAYLESVCRFMQSRETDRASAEEYIKTRISSFSKSPKATGNDYLWSMATFFDDDHFDDSDESWGYGARTGRAEPKQKVLRASEIKTNSLGMIIND